MRWVKVGTICLMLGGCGALNPLQLLGGGPKVAANVQAGQTNHQTLGSVTDQQLVRPRARNITQSADRNEIRGDSVVVNKTGFTAWHVLALIIWTWFWYEMPAPRHMRKWLAAKWKR